MDVTIIKSKMNNVFYYPHEGGNSYSKIAIEHKLLSVANDAYGDILFIEVSYFTLRKIIHLDFRNVSANAVCFICCKPLLPVLNFLLKELKKIKRRVDVVVMESIAPIEILDEVMAFRSSQGNVKLTVQIPNLAINKHEFRVMQILLSGKTCDDASKILSINVKAVYRYKRSLKIKLGITSKLLLL
ncbi:hypothetical protein KJJ67_004474 [Salmonella enterica]|nr:hypothetical protein [Salmonella enterica]